MPPETIIAIVTAVGGGSLFLGAVLFGEGLADKKARMRLYEHQRVAKMLRGRLEDVERQLEEAQDLEQQREENSDRLIDDVTRPLREEVDSLTSKLVESQQRERDLANKLEEKEKLVEELRSRADDTAKSKESDKLDHDDLVAHLERALSKAEGDRDRVQAELARVVEQDVASLNNKVEELHAKLRHASQQEATVSPKESAAGSLTAVEERLAACEQRRQSLEEQLAKTRQRMEVSERLMDGVRARSNALARDLAAAQSELAELRGE